MSAYGKTWRAANREHTKEYKEKNKDRDRARSKAWYWANRERSRAQHKARYEANKDEMRRRSREEYYANWDKRRLYSQVRNRELKIAAMAAYGGVCACCGESRIEFLAIDHINGDGAQHRRETGLGGMSMYLWLSKNGYPAGFRALCMNCNFALGAFGYCPHDREKQAAS
jgi:hypothetical protein